MEHGRQNPKDPAMQDQERRRHPDMTAADENDAALQETIHQDTQRDARRAVGADRLPTPEEEAATKRAKVPRETPERYKGMPERGAHQQGEGRID
jgi:hypothetical protein